ncbi:MAG TPA: hypothetical protein P5119_04045 [Candidatus Aminicenantes bacterium]|nr:hypothetical protein [Candidatus Aminicenantes bacterium]HRY64496.1 hypothetical protein [Candidatus Aminicenantes bacterium]HRZ71409.1 hypothetical protein [Candidatus Aminicenantes bacterium]
MPEGPQELLSSWKEIAAYLKRTVRTCQRLEAAMGLPIHRLDGSPKAHVFAYPPELDAWLSKMVHERKRKRLRFLPVLLAAAAAVSAVAMIFIFGIPGSRKPAVLSVAVLPFDDLSPDKGYEYLARGIPETVSNTLSLLRGLRVTGRTSAAAVKARNIDVREIGRILSVRYLVEGSVQVMDGRLRVASRLIDTGSGYEFGETGYDRAMGDIFDIQDGIGRSIVDNLGVTLLAGEESALRKRPTLDDEVYALYLQGGLRLGRGKLGAAREALPFFEEALKRNPRFALAYAGIAFAYINMQWHFEKPPAEVFPLAEEAVRKALALDPDLPEGLTFDGWVKFQYRWDWDAAGKSFERALELKPGDSLTRGMYAFYLLSRRRFEEARAEIKLAIALDPLMPLLSAYSMWIHMSSGRPEDTLKEFARFQRIETGLEFTYTGAGFANLALGRIDEAVAMFEIARRLPWNSGRAEAGLVMCRLKKGDRQAAEALYGEMLGKREKVLVSPVMLAGAAVSLGRTDQAIEWLEEAVRRIDPQLPTVHVYAAAYQPDFARDPRFLAILDRLRLPH